MKQYNDWPYKLNIVTNFIYNIYKWGIISIISITSFIYGIIRTIKLYYVLHVTSTVNEIFLISYYIVLIIFKNYTLPIFKMAYVLSVIVSTTMKLPQ